MKTIKKYWVAGSLLLTAIGISCQPDESLYPLPYDDRATGSYLRGYQIVSNVWDLDDMTNSGFDAIYESVDRNGGSDLDRVEFYVTHRSGATALITDEVLVKTLTRDEMGFTSVAEPTYSEYLRSGLIRISAAETLAALATLTTDPDGTGCSNIFPDVCSMVAFPGVLAVGDRIIFRLKIYDNQGRAFTVANPQTSVTPALGNQNEANITPNLTGGQFYNSPMTYTMLVQRTTTTGNPNAYTGDYRMSQVAIWQPDHTAVQHQSFAPGWLDKFVFGNSNTDSTQTVTLAKVPGGLPTQRQFTCNYRGQSVSMVINLEMAVLGQTGAGLNAAALSTVSGPTSPTGFGFPAGTTNTNLGTVYVPLMNSGVDCTTEREFYMVTPLAGTYTGLSTLPYGLPKSTVPNRGHYRIDRDGLTPGDVFTITIDDDCDEYGRRNGYCNWYTRVTLTLTKL
jgi:hypothetical protein